MKRCVNMICAIVTLTVFLFVCNYPGSKRVV